jgi:signal peptidase I
MAMGIEQQPIEAEVGDHEKPRPKRSYRRLWCAMTSAAIPGLGDWILGAKRRGLIFSGLFVLVLICYWPLRLPRFYWAFIVVLIAGMLLNVISSCCTLLVNRQSTDAARNWWVLVLFILGCYFAAAAVPVELRSSGFRVFSIASQSMSPTVELGDDIVVDTRYFHRRPVVPGSVIVYRHKGIFLVKRVIATSGSTVVSAHDRLKVDGRALVEPYTVHRDSDHPPDERDDFGPVQVRSEEVFVMGDNRDFSLDSRFLSGENEYGPVYNSDVVGKPLYRFHRTVRGSPYDGQAIK